MESFSKQQDNDLTSRNKTCHKSHIRTHRWQIVLLVLCIVSFLLLITPFLINISTNHRLHYALIEFKGLFAFGTGNYTSLGHTPDNKYALHLVNNSWQATSINIEATKNLSYKPFLILSLDEESLKAPIGPLTKEFDIVCSKDSRYIAMIRNGWYLDFFDFKDSFRDTFKPWLFGQVEEKEMEEWRVYHNRISAILGQDTISILDNLEDIEEDTR